MTNKTRRNRQRKNKREGKLTPEADETQAIGSRILAEAVEPATSSEPSNQPEKEPGFLRTMASTLLNRLQLSNLAGLQFNNLRNLYDVFGYQKRLTSEHFFAKYIRQDICSRIIDAPPGATWSNPPTMEGPEGIEEAWKEMDRRVGLYDTMNRCDRLARLGHYSLFMFGFDDGKASSEVGNVTNLLYVRPISSRMVKNIKLETNTRDPRFGQPVEYEINFDDPAKKVIQEGNVTVQGVSKLILHHSRVVHIVESPLEDSVFGIPIIEKVYNLLDDLLKVGGGTSEMFWLGARQGLQADVDKEMDLDPDDAAKLSDELDDFQHQLRRIVRTRGVKLNTLESQVANPKEIFDMLMGLISGTTGIPRRILLGSEAGQLASEQDRANWAERITERRVLFAEPAILRPVVQTLQGVGLLNEGDVEYEWPSAFRMSPLEDGQMMAQKARAVGNFSRQTGNQTPMQIISEEESREILGLEGTIDEADRFVPPVEEEPEVPEGGDGDKENSPPGAQTPPGS